MISMHDLLTLEVSAIEIKISVRINMVTYINASQVSNLLYLHFKKSLRKSTTWKHILAMFEKSLRNTL